MPVRHYLEMESKFEMEAKVQTFVQQMTNRNRTLKNVHKNAEKLEKIIFSCFEPLTIDLKERIEVENTLDLI